MALGKVNHGKEGEPVLLKFPSLVRYVSLSESSQRQGSHHGSGDRRALSLRKTKHLIGKSLLFSTCEEEPPS